MVEQYFDRRQSATKADIENLKELILVMFTERDRTLATTLEAANDVRQQISQLVRRTEHEELARQLAVAQKTIQDKLNDCAPRSDMNTLRDEFNRAVVARTQQMDRLEQSQVAMQARYALISVIIGFVLSALGVWVAWGGPHHG